MIINDKKDIYDPILNKVDLQDFLRREFPQVPDDFVVDQITRDGVVVRLRVNESHLRPGGTVSGPAMFGLTDVGVYLAILSRVGLESLSVTTSCSMDFMRKPKSDRDLLADVTLLKLGQALVVANVLIRSEGTDAPVARASMTYSRPPRPEQGR